MLSGGQPDSVLTTLQHSVGVAEAALNKTAARTNAVNWVFVIVNLSP